MRNETNGIEGKGCKRMSFIRHKHFGNQTYYYEVENYRIEGKVVQRHLRYLGKNGL